jgi:pyridoxal 5'-phosphate synthase pdxT subunit
MKIGVLSFQGDFEAHTRAVRHAGGEPVEVRNTLQLFDSDALIIPGGESTTLLKFFETESFTTPLLEFARERPIFGTCAGAILLARDVENPLQPSLGLIDIGIRRNAYGRQTESHVTICHSALLEPNDFEAIFIRAPLITRIGPGVEVLARDDKDPVLLREGRHWAATFHPELSLESGIHRLFLEHARKQAVVAQTRETSPKGTQKVAGG